LNQVLPQEIFSLPQLHLNRANFNSPKRHATSLCVSNRAEPIKTSSSGKPKVQFLLMKREAGGLGEFLLFPQGKAASPRFMGVIELCTPNADSGI
jgi:hypothetical protein